MPEISRFYGIVIHMYFQDHAPPHFHAKYAGESAEIGIDPVEILKGRIKPRALSLVTEWAKLHQSELLQNWDILQTDANAKKVEPLQ